MRIEILTLFPEMFPSVFSASILGKAQEKGLVHFRYVNFRDYSTNKHHAVDDYPFGGGGGMVLQVEPIYLALQDLLGGENSFSAWLSTPKERRKPRVILTTPQGEPFRQARAVELSAEEHLIFICGHYEGYDERIREYLVTDEFSIGDFILTGGEIAAMAMIDSIVRLRKGVLGNELSSEEESFSDGLLEYPQYTRPADFHGWKVPEVLLSGHHERIREWRRAESLRRTRERRPDLLRGIDQAKE